MIFKIKSCVLIAHGIYFLLFKSSSFSEYVLNTAGWPGLLHAGPFFHSQISEEPRSGRLLTLLPTWHHQGQLQSQHAMISHGDLLVRAGVDSQAGGAGAPVLENMKGICRLLVRRRSAVPPHGDFPKQKNTDMLLFKTIHHLADHLLAQSPLPVFILYFPLSFSLPSLFSSTPSHSLCSLSPSFMHHNIFPFNNMEYPETQVKPKPGSKPRRHSLKWQPLVIGEGLQLYGS